MLNIKLGHFDVDASSVICHFCSRNANPKSQILEVISHFWAPKSKCVFMSCDDEPGFSCLPHLRSLMLTTTFLHAVAALLLHCNSHNRQTDTHTCTHAQISHIFTSHYALFHICLSVCLCLRIIYYLHDVQGVLYKTTTLKLEDVCVCVCARVCVCVGSLSINPVLIYTVQKQVD